MPDVFIGLGSNLGDKEANIRKAIELVDHECVVLKISRLYRTEPVGFKEQDWFINAAVEVETRLKPKALLTFLKGVEKRMGRKESVKDGPRLIDLDILFYDDLAFDGPGLKIPHPRMHQRRFVLEPLMELCPEHVHPVLKKTVKQLFNGLKGSEKVELYRS